MADDKLKIWDALGRTDPKHTKGFTRAGGFKGTAVKPIYTAHKMTEQFGPAGKGWGMGEPKFDVVPGSDGQVAVFCTVGVWWGTREQFVYGVGGDMVVVKQSNGLRTDDEAFKKAFTDAVGNGMKQLGMSADVHMGLFDDSKYVNELRAEMAAETPEPVTKPKRLSRDMYEEMAKEIDACLTLDDLGFLWRSQAFQNEFKTLPKDWQDMLTNHKDARKAELSAPPNGAFVPPDFSKMETT